jgi:gamma-glutamylcyclotransferase (GGCT)/AIG2-like uncharacterized protein YtfP
MGASHHTKSDKRAPGHDVLARQWGSSRLRRSNSQSGSPAPWSADLSPTVASPYLTYQHRFHPARVRRQAGPELAMTLFLYGTLLDRAALAARSGDAKLAERCVPATLTGWQRVAMRGGPYPTLRRLRGGVVRGALVTVSAHTLARLAAYEGPVYRLTRVVVQTPKGKTAAQTWIAPAATRRPWRE